MIKSKFTVIIVLLMTVGAIWACNQDAPRYDDPVGSDGWLKGDVNEKFDRIADQLGGFDKTMIEVGYRYNELYFAAQDENWEYAKYQLEEMEEAMKAGLERRPAREESSEKFMNEVIPEMLNSLDKGEKEAIAKSIQVMKNECNACHTKENMGFIRVSIPENRVSPVKWERLN